MDNLLKQIAVGGAISVCNKAGVPIITPKGYEKSEEIYEAAKEHDGDIHSTNEEIEEV